MQKTRKKIRYCRLALREGSAYRMALAGEDALSGTGGGYFAYLAPVFDTMDAGCSFHRFRLHGEFHGCKYEVTAAATNADIRGQVLAEGATPKGQAQTLRGLPHVRKVNCGDFLLHGLSGRYLWVQVAVSAARADSRFEVTGFEVEFPESSFAEYFPETYQGRGDTSFYRYMAALQSLYEGLEGKVSEVPQMLDYETADAGSLYTLAGWAGLGESGAAYTPGQLRAMIRDLNEIQAGKGTARVLEKMLSLTTGRDAYVVEYFKWHGWMAGSPRLLGDYGRLYGADRSVFTVLLDFRGVREEGLPDRQWVMGQVEEYAPFGLKCNLAYLRAGSHMDTHCYLDVNGSLSTPATADTKGFVLGGDFVLG